MWIQECWLHNFAICFSATEVTMLMDVSWFLCRENFKISVLSHFHTQQICCLLVVFRVYKDVFLLFSEFHPSCGLQSTLTSSFMYVPMKNSPLPPPHVDNVATRWVHGYSMYRSFVNLGINGYISYHDLNRLFQKHALNWMFTYL